MNLPALRPRRTFILPLLALTLLGSGCKKVADAIRPKLPDATQEGKDTFGCLLNDKVWLPNRESSLDDILEADLTGAGQGFTLKAEDNHTPANFYLQVYDAATLRPGTYRLGSGFAASYDVFRNGKSEQYHGGSGDQGSVTITKYEPFTRTHTVLGQPVVVKGAIVSGTFEFTAAGVEGGSITVREGRFDVQAFE